MKLVIVESPAKAKIIAGYLGDDFVVESSIGHIRDLPRKASDIPASYKEEAWARLGVDTANDFKALYVVPSEKKKQISRLKKLLKEADELYLATDEDLAAGPGEANGLSRDHSRRHSTIRFRTARSRP